MMRTKVSPFGMAVVAAIIAAATLHDSHAKDPKQKNPIPTHGKTADGKYPIYDLKGDLADINYATSNGVVYSPDGLVGRVEWLKPEDANTANYRCDFVCKDKNDRVVGLNPEWKKVYGAK